MNRFLDRPLGYTRTQREARDAVRYACSVQAFSSPPMHLHDRIVCWACLAATLALLAITLIWGV